MPVPDLVGLHGEHALSLLFLVSGAAGLIFEVVWFYKCGLVFGNSTWATSIVLSSFMGGLALGNALVARYAPRIRCYLWTYAALEALVAVSGVALTYGLADLTSLLAPVTRSFADTLWLGNLVRLVTAFAVLVVPATAMGGTLPVLVGALCRWRPGFGRALGLLYGWNTLGAVTGVVGAEVVLIPHVGVMGSAWIAALLDLSAAAAALWISHQARENVALAVDRIAQEPAAPSSISWRLLWCAFLAGGALMALEVVWFRFLSMFVANNTLAISLMLATVLTAIGLGGLAASSWLSRDRDAATYLPAVALTTGFVMVVSYGTFQFVIGDSRVLNWYRILWFACSLSFPASLLSGVLFTLLGEALKRGVVIETRAAGWLLLANTAGAMSGPVIAAFVLLPVLGMERSVFALAIPYGIIGFLAIRDPSYRRPKTASWAFPTAALAIVLAAVLFPFGLMSQTYFALAAREHTGDGSEIVVTHEGSGETIFLIRQAWEGEPIYYRLVTNGISMSATTAKAKRYMRYFVYLPLLLHKSPLRRVLVICYGLGVTAGAVTDVSSVESIDVAEISRDIVTMSDTIYPVSQNPLHDPRVRLHVEDGRYFLQTTGERFDLITGEPPPPLTPGAVNIYTREYFQLIHERLAEGGIATYWLPVARLAGTDHAAIIRAFCDVFEDCSLWNSTPADLMLLGTRHANGPLPAATFSTAWNDPVLGAHLREVGFESPEQIGATFIGDAAYLQGLTAHTPPLTDDYPRRLRVPAGSSLLDPRRRLDWSGAEFYRDVIDPQRARRAFEASAFVQRLWPETLLRETIPFFEVQHIINRILTVEANPLRQIEDLNLVLTRTPLRRLPLWLLGLDNHPILERVDGLPNDGSGQLEYVRGLRALVARDYVGAAAYLAQSEQRGVRGIRPLLVYSLCLAGELDEAKQLGQGDVDASNADQRHFWTWLHATYGAGGG
jgi:spermidine synthase